jgi:hypothetical protein
MSSTIKTLFSCLGEKVSATIALSFVFGIYCLIMD